MVALRDFHWAAKMAAKKGAEKVDPSEFQPAVHWALLTAVQTADWKVSRWVDCWVGCSVEPWGKQKAELWAYSCLVDLMAEWKVVYLATKLAAQTDVHLVDWTASRLAAQTADCSALRMVVLTESQ